MDKGELVNDAERRLWDAFTRGRMVDLGPGDPADEQFDPTNWGASRTVRAEVIARLLLGVRDEERGHIAKVGLAGAWITGEVNLNGGTTPYELLLDRCWLDRAPDLGEASTRSVEAVSCRMPGFVAHGWRAAGSADFTRSRFAGDVDLMGARIDGPLDMSSATLTNPAGNALNAQDLTVEQNLHCREGFSATGTVNLAGAKVGGQLDMTGATLTNPDGEALQADSLTVAQNMYCDDGFSATGTVNLAGASIGGQLSMVNATLTDPAGNALNAQDLTVEQNIYCREGFSATGTVSLMGARVGGQLDMSGATLTNPDGEALQADNLTVAQNMFCGEGFTATGTVNLAGATIGGQLNMEGAKLTHAGGGFAFSALDLTVGRDTYFTNGFAAEGPITLSHARLAGVSFAGATLKLPEGADPDSYLMLDGEAMTARSLTLPESPPGVTDLRQATLGVLAIQPSALTARMRLSGLTYTDLDPDPDPPVKWRLAWLGNDPDGYHPQPYEQLAAYYRVNGHDREARRVLLAKRRARRRLGPTGPQGAWRRVARLRRLPGLIVDWLAGYGYAPGRAFIWLLTAIGLGTWLLYDYALGGTPTGDRTTNAVLLALDAILPTSPLGLRDATDLHEGQYITAIVLQGFGFALSLAVLPALTRALARADK